LGVYSSKHVPDGAVLASCIHRLQDDEQRVLAFGPEYSLELLKAFGITLKIGLGIPLALIVATEARIMIGQIDPRARWDEKWVRHGLPPMLLG
jgi:hypothetical protein